MALFRHALPQLSGQPYLTDAGIETDLIFNHGIEIREFAAHTLLATEAGREAVATYLREFLSLAQAHGVGFILDSQTWKAHMHWADDLAASESELHAANLDAIRFIAELRDAFSANAQPIVLNAVVGPRGDAYVPDRAVAAQEAETYHAQQLSWLAETDVDMVTALTFTSADEAIGFVWAAQRFGLPVVVSFTVETDGRLPNGQSLEDAIRTVDQATDSGAAYFMVNCAHPDHFAHILKPEPWAERLRGIRCNASRKSHAELDESDTLDDGNPSELAEQYQSIKQTLPWINVYGSCCGSDVRHVRALPRRCCKLRSFTQKKCMLLFIGGAARTGKGMVVRRLLHEQHLPYLNLDALKMGLTRGAPEFPIDPDAGGPAVAERLWPIVREMSHNLIADQVSYVFEGELLPAHVAALQQRFPSQVAACFLGYAQISPAQKLQSIRAHSGHPNDWSSTYSDAALLRIIEREIVFSRFLRAECEAHGLTYFDTSEQFLVTLDRTVAYVRETLHTGQGQ